MKSLLTLLDDYEIIEVERHIYETGGESAVLHVESRTNEDTIGCMFEVPWEHVKDYVGDIDLRNVTVFTQSGTSWLPQASQ